ncbi:MAG: 3-hydroxyacyl-CoA dehydrogenase NAD-binding domain-containing protein [Anaerolineales bacterium]|nr:3-hydroxyacyl-CoA dehydrogenase NAD-binding domain-containing protein [Anaerolineales bacterium]
MIQTVSVIGAGTMGTGIAQASALGGCRVLLHDVAEEFVQRGLATIHKQMDEGVARKKITPEAAKAAKESVRSTLSLAEAADADLIIEAAPEKLELKRELFAQLDALAPARTIFASNTSSLSINALAAATRRADRFVGLHFFNPAHLMPLVEVIPSDSTSDETLQAVTDYVLRIKKTPVRCKDTPAFIVNRVARPFYGEALRLLGEGAADVPTIDALLESAGFKMGPFRLIDLIGCDVNFAVTQSVYEAYFQDPKYRPHPIQRRMVESGRLGRKTKRGFYDYD